MKLLLALIILTVSIPLNSTGCFGSSQKFKIANQATLIARVIKRIGCIEKTTISLRDIEMTDFFSRFADKSFVIEKIPHELDLFFNNLWREISVDAKKQMGVQVFNDFEKGLKETFTANIIAYKPIFLEILLKEDHPHCFENLIKDQ